MNAPRLRFKGFKTDWVEKSLSQISDIKTGPFGSALHEHDYVDEGTPIITVEHLGDGSIQHVNLPLVSEEDKTRLRSYLLKPEDIVFSRVGSVDRSCLVSKKEDGWLFSGRLLRLRVTDTNTSPSFLNQNFKTRLNKHRIRSVAVGQTMASLNTEILKKFTLHFPETHAEQLKISSLLSLFDEKITCLDTNLRLSIAYKQGMVQKLLSQEIRFRDKKGNNYPNWSHKKLSEISKKKASSISANKIDGNIGQYKVYGASGVLKNVDFYSEEAPYISVVKDGAGVGRAFLCEGKSSVLGTMEMVLPLESMNVKYLFELINRINFREYITGSTIPHVYYKDYSLEIIPVPSIQEQEKIANFLSAIDEKIANVQQQLELTKQYKQGLLQQMFI
jgi:type I restriction enzyme S subunit